MEDTGARTAPRSASAGAGEGEAEFGRAHGEPAQESGSRRARHHEAIGRGFLALCQKVTPMWDTTVVAASPWANASGSESTYSTLARVARAAAPLTSRMMLASLWSVSAASGPAMVRRWARSAAPVATLGSDEPAAGPGAHRRQHAIGREYWRVHQRQAGAGEARDERRGLAARRGGGCGQAQHLARR